MGFLGKGEVKGFARHANGDVENITFKRPDCSGVFLGTIQASSPGDLSIEAICESAEKSIKTSLLVEN